MLRKARCCAELDAEHTLEPQATLMIGSLDRYLDLEDHRSRHLLVARPRLRVRIEEDEVSLDKELVGIVHNTDREHDLKVTRMCLRTYLTTHTLFGRGKT